MKIKILASALIAAIFSSVLCASDVCIQQFQDAQQLLEKARTTAVLNEKRSLLKKAYDTLNGTGCNAGTFRMSAIYFLSQAINMADASDVNGADEKTGMAIDKVKKAINRLADEMTEREKEYPY